MEHAYLYLLHLLSAHAQWTLAFVFLASLLESLALIGTFIPGSTALFIAGALAGAGTINLGWLFAVSIAGAVAGDGLSYGIGHRYRDTLALRWPFAHYPAMFAKARTYFVEHGARSVIVARFVGPLRAVVPVVAGMAGMRPLRFLTMNVVSALIWAPAHILPGVVFGASLQIAGAVSFRLVAIALMLVLAGWLIWRITRTLLLHLDAWASASRQRAARWAQQHHGPAARRLAALLDPRHSALGALIAVTAFLPIGAAVFSYVVGNLLHGTVLTQIDQSVLQFLRSIHTVWADNALARIETLGSNATLAALVATGVIWMAFERRWRTIVYWVVAAAVSQVLILAIRLAVHHAMPGNDIIANYVFPSDRVASVVIVYGFMMYMLVRRVNGLQAATVATLVNAIIVAVTFAGLYFERFLFSDALGGAALALLWVAAIVFMSLWRYPQRPPQRDFMPAVVLAVLAAAFIAQRGREPGNERQQEAPVVVSQSDWTDAVWRYVPCYRVDMKGERREPKTLQWAASAGDLRAALRAAGWSDGAHFTMANLLSLVAPDVDVLKLPLLPRLDNGLPSPLVFERASAPDGAARAGSARDVLRFWPSGYAVAADGSPGSAGDDEAVPLWSGSLVHERLRRESWPFNVLIAAPEQHGIALGLATSGGSAAWRVMTRSNSRACDGRPVTLIAAQPH